MSNRKILTDEEIASALQKLEGWSVQSGEMCAEFTFRDFVQAIDFINKIAVLAEEMNHHPEFCIAYNKVSFSFCTHDVGNKITDADIEIAAGISTIANDMHLET